MNILHVMSEFPCPPDNGIRADIWGRVRAMSGLGHRIDVLVMKQKQTPDVKHLAELQGLVNSVRFVERRPLPQCLATVTPTAVARNGWLANIPVRETYDVAVAEGDDTSPIFSNPRLQANVRVLRVHNNESQYLWASAQTEESMLRRQFCRVEALRFWWFARTAYASVDSLWFISESEWRTYAAKHAEAARNAVWLPPSIVFGEPVAAYKGRLRRVLFVASLHISLNREALRWYLKQVHPRLCHDPAYELVVAGSTNGRRSAELFVDEIRRQSRCSVHINVEDLNPLYRDCAVFINPMQRGTGVKLKNIHAIERNIPVVTTEVGNDGSGFSDNEDVLVADTAEEFASAVSQLLNNPTLRLQMAGCAYRKLAEAYNCEANIQRIFTTLIPVDSRLPSAQQALSA